MRVMQPQVAAGGRPASRGSGFRAHPARRRLDCPERSAPPEMEGGGRCTRQCGQHCRGPSPGEEPGLRRAVCSQRSCSRSSRYNLCSGFKHDPRARGSVLQSAGYDQACAGYLPVMGNCASAMRLMDPFRAIAHCPAPNFMPPNALLHVSPSGHARKYALFVAKCEHNRTPLTAVHFGKDCAGRAPIGPPLFGLLQRTLPSSWMMSPDLPTSLQRRPRGVE